MVTTSGTGQQGVSVCLIASDVKLSQHVAVCVHSSDRTPLAWPLCIRKLKFIHGGSNMTGTDLYVNKPHCAAAVRP